jgi:hypothetical protein
MLIRECQDLGHGFWVPTPPRCVPLDGGVNLIVALATTEELRVTLSPNVKVAGVARVLDNHYSCDLKVEAFESWCRTPDSLGEWTKNKIEELTKELQPTVQPEGNIQVYTNWRPFLYSKGGEIVSRWVNLDLLKDTEVKTTGICRERRGQIVKYFFAAFKNGILKYETQLSHSFDVNRLIHGLDFISGNQCNLYTEKHATKIHFTLPREIPKEEYRLLIALCTNENTNNGRTRRFIIEQKLYVNLKNMLEKLGYCWRES